MLGSVMIGGEIQLSEKSKLRETTEEGVRDLFSPFLCPKYQVYELNFIDVHRLFFI